MSRDLSDRPQRVLVVDDVSHLRFALRQVLEAEGGWEVVAEAANGGEARRMAVAHRPDAIVLDHQMPVLTGLQALPYLRRSCPQARIVMWTSSTDACGGAEQLGADAVVDKAGPVEHLLAALRLPERRPEPSG